MRPPPIRRLPLLRLALVLGVSIGFGSACNEAPRRVLPAVGERPPGWVDVRLTLPEAGDPTLGASGPFVVVDRTGRERLRGEALDYHTPIWANAARVVLGELELGPPPVEFRPLESTTLSVNGNRYRSLIRIECPPGKQMRVLNRISIEDYVKGVLPGEMPDRFGLEALKAQAVAARSYALSEGAQRGFLYPDVRSQVYGGRDAETWMASRAVETTAGQVLTHEGQVMSAWFQSTCGGGTARAADVFNNPPDGVLDRTIVCADCRTSPTWRWSRLIDVGRICKAVDLPEAPLDSVELEPALFPGRPIWITVKAGGQSSRIRVVDFRDRVSKGRPWDQQLLSTRWAAEPRIEEGQLRVEGHGWGHGVGLCQYGARGYARRGAGYRVILRRYYPGADLVQLQ